MHGTATENARKPVSHSSAENLKLANEALRQIEQLRDAVTGPMPTAAAAGNDLRPGPGAGLAGQQTELGEVLRRILNGQAMLLADLGGPNTAR